jgi:ABC-type arginine/histidine transport system permease subunit
MHCQEKVYKKIMFPLLFSFFGLILGYITYCTFTGISDLWSILQQAWSDIIIFFKNSHPGSQTSILKAAIAVKGK